MTLLYDAHAHVGSMEELTLRNKQNIFSLICASCPDEAKKLEELTGDPLLSPIICLTFGLHPWKAEQISFQEMEPWLLKAPVIGEIGMDSVWCSVPLSVQEKAFCSQLELASAMKKPVILHTKGQEIQIARLIKKYPNTYLVHWYSGEEGFSEFLDSDCYFTIGPDVFCNPSVQKAAVLAPENRILVETDGCSAVKWAYDQNHGCQGQLPPWNDIAAVLKYSISITASLRGISPEALAVKIEENFHRFRPV